MQISTLFPTAATLARASTFLQWADTAPVSHIPSPLAWVGGLHRSARILVPAGDDVRSGVAAFIEAVGTYDDRMENGISVCGHSWTVADASPHTVVSDKRTSTQHAVWSVISHDIAPSSTPSSVSDRKWTLVRSNLSDLASPGGAVVCICVEYTVPQWAFPSAWEVTVVSGKCGGWLRQWETVATRLGCRLLTVSQLSPAQEDA